ncbi:flagellar basal body P-ring protein FlgI [Dasania sp. GY-MA-18]|uniref:Flagellar P-ring protein n=1 Tax=Dasania phycosphaerae TaxID=2950436 RepID=A0A9J6RGP6_9GAMM|nr:MULTISPECIES: flagellar basal body P-ring protein FlgI [Dasania]MCR8921394.1 flagellar basal body P-ring protein FlgI [Dasania sp. GY-MA-18]MCZ0863822.1 flagellar basal body P-ring protein FlgI [Dasania phycosphaerae]MCZ0867550.1 flagellar basal body P-ring protein FlgI [Dasania phycosphaerae]
MNTINKLISAVIFLAVLTPVSYAERLKDITTLAGVRDNPLVGYGLVVGLDGTGDKTSQAPFTAQSFKSMLNKFGITIPEGSNFQLKNVAAVTIHANLPAFVKPGQKIDVSVASIANSKSLRGGSLLMAPLKGADGNIYAIAQGELVVGGFGTEGRDGSKVTVNIPSAGRIPNGAIVERAVSNAFTSSDHLIFNLNRADFTTARRIAENINELLGPNIARAMDASSVRVTAPMDMDQRVSYMSLLENVTVQPGEAPARVVINSRTGTIVVGKHVTVAPSAVTHGSLTVTVTEGNNVSQPNPFGEGETVVVPETGEVTVTQANNKMFELKGSTTLDQIVRAVNEVGAAPGDLMAILEALKQAGALEADLIVI